MTSRKKPCRDMVPSKSETRIGPASRLSPESCIETVGKIRGSFSCCVRPDRKRANVFARGWPPTAGDASGTTDAPKRLRSAPRPSKGGCFTIVAQWDPCQGALSIEDPQGRHGGRIDRHRFGDFARPESHRTCPMASGVPTNED